MGRLVFVPCRDSDNDGTVAFREAKNVAARDKLGPKQHALADVLKKIFAGRMDLAVVEWGVGD